MGSLADHSGLVELNGGEDPMFALLRILCGDQSQTLLIRARCGCIHRSQALSSAWRLQERGADSPGAPLAEHISGYTEWTDLQVWRHADGICKGWVCLGRRDWTKIKAIVFRIIYSSCLFGQQ